jgi:GNAT superfamily N-acetyltransferase
MSPLYKLKDYKETFKFEREHPPALRWEPSYKMYMFHEDEKIQGIWLRDKNELVGEIVLTWQSDNVVHVESFTVLPSHRSKGLGHELVRLAVEWGTNSNYKYLTGEARKGASWKVFQNFGGEEILTYQNWGGTKEDYVFFKIDL